MSDPYYPTNQPYGGSPPNPPPYGQPPYGQPPPPPQYGQPPSPPPYGQPPPPPPYGQPPSISDFGQPPAYAQPPTFGQPPAGPYYGAPYGAPPPPSKSRKSMWIVIAAAVLVLIGGGTAVAVVLNHGSSVTEHLASPPPATIGKFTLSPDPSGNLTGQGTTDDIRNEVDNPTGTLAALYLEGDDLTKPVVVVAVTGTVNNPDSKITQVFQEEGAEQFTNVHSVDPGNLSGTAKCGSATQDGETLAVCVWVDSGSLGAVVCLNREPAEVEDIFRQVRNAVLTRET